MLLLTASWHWQGSSSTPATPSDLTLLQANQGSPACLRTGKIHGAPAPWCSFLKLGGISNHTTRTGYRLLLQHFGSEKALDAKLPLFLRWDSCQECGLKSGD